MDSEIMRNSLFKNNRYTIPMVFNDEVWIQISSFIPEVEDRYWVSNYGRVYDSRNNYCIPPSIQPSGYLFIHLNKKREYYSEHKDHCLIIKLHRLICMAFNGLPYNYKDLHVNHKDSIVSDCHADNLEWVTPKENVYHSFKYGNRQVGENSNRSVYTEKQVRSICELMQNGIYDNNTICMNVFGHGCTDKEKTLIYNIRNRLFWTSVSKDYNIIPSDKKFVLTEDQIHSICKLLESDTSLINPLNKKAANIIALKALGIDLHAIDPKESIRIRTCINNIKGKRSYTEISSQYNF